MVKTYKIYDFCGLYSLFISLSFLSGQYLFNQSLQAAEVPSKNAFALYNSLQQGIACLDTEKTNIYLPKVIRQGLAQIAERERWLHKLLSGNMTLAASLPEPVRAEARLIDSLKTMVKATARYWMEQDAGSLKDELNLLRHDFREAPFIMVLLAEGYAFCEEYTLAQTCYRKALEANPQAADLRVKLAQVCQKCGDQATALRLYQSAVEQDPANGPLLKEYINVTEKCGQLGDLAERWELLVRAHPDYEELKKHLIAVWNKLGRNDKVTALLNKQERAQ